MATANPYARYERKRNTQFPSKFPALPGINDSPQVPVRSSGARSVELARVDENDASRQTETRLHVMEKSNRALLEEVVRLQSELKATVRRSEDSHREERLARQGLENSLRSSNELISQMSGRLTSTEEKLAEERSIVAALVNLTKSMEQTMLGGQQDLFSRRDQQAARIQELRGQLDEVTRAKEQLERVTFQMVDDIRHLKSRVDSQTSDFSTVASDLKNKSRRLEEENRMTMESMRKHGETQNAAEQSTYQLRQQVETRLQELRDVLIELRGKQETEAQEKRMFEQQVNLRIADMAAAVAEEVRKREETMHALDILQREKEHAADTERIKLQGKIGEIAEEVSKKMLQKEMKLREETQAKFAQMEQRLLGEQESRLKHERDQREELDRRWENLKRLSDEEMQQLRENQRAEKKEKSTDCDSA